MTFVGSVSERCQRFASCGYVLFIQLDLTRIDGIDVCTAMTVLAEVGVDMSKFPTAKHFAAWLGLAPGTKISGGKVLSSKANKTANKAAMALRQRCLVFEEKPIGAGCLLPAHVRQDGQAQGDHGRSPQAGQADLHDGHQGPGGNPPAKPAQ